MKKLILTTIALIGIVTLLPIRAGQNKDTEMFCGICSAINLTPNKGEHEDLISNKPVKVGKSITTEALTESTSWQVTEDEYHLLALVVEAEAGDQDLIGKRLVVDVTLNRAASAQFPNSIYGVIFQRNQFSTTFDGAFDRVRRDGICGETYQAIDMELYLNNDRYNTEVLFFTMGYYNPYCKPMFVWGTHYFGK